MMGKARRRRSNGHCWWSPCAPSPARPPGRPSSTSTTHPPTWIAAPRRPAAHPVAFAETTAESRGKTTLATDAVVSEAQLVAPEKVGALPSGHPLFLPTIRSAQVGIPAVERLLGRPTAVEIVFDPVYLANGFTSPNNKGEVFANLAYKLDLPFGAEKGGGLIKPDTSIQALSRSLGPVANATAIKQGTFDTSMFDKARFLGGITLRDILSPVPFNLDNVKAADLPLPELEARLADPGFRLEVPMLTSRPIYPDGVNPNDPAAKPFAAETRFLWKPVVRNYKLGIFELEDAAHHAARGQGDDCSRRWTAHPPPTRSTGGCRASR